MTTGGSSRVDGYPPGVWRFPGEPLAFLAEASATLASSLDYTTTLRNVAALLVPSLADWCAIDLATEAGDLERVAIMHNDPAKLEFAEKLRRRYPLDPESPRGVANVLRTGEAELYPEITDELLQAGARDAEHLELLRKIGMSSAMIVPLRARGRTLGAMTLVTDTPGRHFTPRDLSLAEDLANRCALAVENARLYRDARQALEQHARIAHELSVLVEASQALTRSLEPEAVLSSILELSRSIIAADAYAIWRFDRAAREWRVVRDAGLSADYSRVVPMVDDSTPSIPEQPAGIEDVEQVELLATRRDAYRREGIRSMLLVPLRFHGEISGTQVFYYRQRRTFSDEAVRLAAALGNLTASALQTADLYAQQTRLREESQQAEARYRFLVENTSDAVWRFDLCPPMPLGLSVDEQIVYGYRHVILAQCNDGMARIYGYDSAAEMTGLSLAEILPRSDLINLDFLRQFIRSGYRLVDHEARTTARDGSDRYVLCNVVGMIEGGRLCSVFGTSRDITERHTSQQALRESEERFRTMADSAPVLLWQSDPSGAGTFFNRPWLEFTGRTLEQELGDGWIDCIHPDDRTRTIESCLSAIQQRQPFRMEWRMRRADGEWRWVLDTGIPRFTPAGEFAGYIGSCIDITDRIAIEQQLQNVNDLLEQRVAERTAEVAERNEQLQMLALNLTAAEHQERRRIAQTLHDHFQQILVAAKLGLEQVRRGADRSQTTILTSQVDGLLTEAIRESRTLAVELCPPVLYDRGLIAALEWLARHLLEQNGLQIDVRVERPVEPESEDVRAFLFQSVRELLLNVVKHAGVNQATVTVSETEARQVEITVADKGQGCDPEELVDRGRTGGAFGLFSIQQRVRLLGGELLLDSAPGAGCRIRLRVPIAAPQSTDVSVLDEDAMVGPTVSKDSRPPVSNHKIRVLLADDHRIVRAGLAGLLRQHPDIEVVGEAADGESAVELARRLRPDVVSMDISMPGLGGIEATRIIKAEMPSIRVIGLSMHESADVAEAILQAGAAAYLPKDGPCESLLMAVRGGRPQ